MGTIQKKHFKTLTEKQFLKHVDDFIDYFKMLSREDKEKYMYQFYYFSDELKRRGL